MISLKTNQFCSCLNALFTLYYRHVDFYAELDEIKEGKIKREDRAGGHARHGLRGSRREHGCREIRKVKKLAPAVGGGWGVAADR